MQDNLLNWLQVKRQQRTDSQTADMMPQLVEIAAQVEEIRIIPSKHYRKHAFGEGIRKSILMQGIFHLGKYNKADFFI